MNKKTFITLLACIVCMMIFAGCNSAKESAAPAPDDTKAEQETEEVKPDDNEDNKAEETQEDIWEEVVGEDERSVSREELFMQVLYKYKEAQDGRFSDEEVEKLGIWTELVQHAWPFGSNNDEVRYQGNLTLCSSSKKPAIAKSRTMTHTTRSLNLLLIT